MDHANRTAAVVPGLRAIRAGRSPAAYACTEHTACGAVVLVCAEGVSDPDGLRRGEAAARFAAKAALRALRGALIALAADSDLKCDAIIDAVRAEAEVLKGRLANAINRHREMLRAVHDSGQHDSPADVSDPSTDDAGRYDTHLVATTLARGWWITITLGPTGTPHRGRSVVAVEHPAADSSGRHFELTQPGARLDRPTEAALGEPEILVQPCESGYLFAFLDPVVSRLRPIPPGAANAAAGGSAEGGEGVIAEPSEDLPTLRHVALALPGASHVRAHGAPCQDAARATCHPAEKLTVLAVADGHGDAKYTHADIGAQIAVDVVTACVPDWLRGDLAPYLRGDLAPYSDETDHREAIERRVRDSLCPALAREWTRRVKLHVAHRHPTRNPPDEDASPASAGDHDHDSEVRAYGTTMLGAALSERYLIVFKLGDGELVLVTDQDEPKRLLSSTDKTYDSATWSLSTPNASAHFEVEVVDLQVHKPRLLLVVSDGVSDAYIPADEAARRAGRPEEFPRVWGTNALRRIERDGFDAWVAELPQLLSRLSAIGAGDDVALAAAYWPGTESPHVAPAKSAPATEALDADSWLTHQAERIANEGWIKWAGDLPCTLAARSRQEDDRDMVIAAAQVSERRGGR